MLRDKLEQYITLLREDLRLSSTCGRAIDTLLKSLRDDTLFANELSQNFKGGEEIPFNITPSDPSQIAVLKKIINGLALAKNGFKSLEEISIKSDRYTLGIASDIFKTAYTAVHELYGAVQLLNTSSADVQAIIGPHLSGLLPKLGIVSQALTDFTPESLKEPGTALAQDPVNFSANAIASAFTMLPTNAHEGNAGLAHASSLIFLLPSYFEALQAQIDTGVSQIPLKSTTTAEGYKEAMLERAKKTKERFEKLASSSSSFLKMPSYLSTMKELHAHSSELMSTAAPLTKVAYEEAVAKLNRIRHDILPKLVTELEILEESMALKPGSLVDPALAQMESYYKQFAGYVDGIAQAAGVLDSASEMANSRYGDIVRLLMGGRRPDVGEKIQAVANLDVLRDETFEEYTAKQRTERLVQAELESKDQSKREAANKFFDCIAGLTWWTHKWSLANATPEVKAELLTYYKQFQEHFAAHNPALDGVIVEALTITNTGNLLTRAVNTDYRQMISSHMKEVMACRDTVIESIKQASAQAAFKARVIQEGDTYHAKRFYEARHHETELHEIRAFKAHPFALEEGLTAADYEIKQLDVAVQLHNLKKAKKALIRFSSHLESHASDTEISTLDAGAKESLRKQYKVFQSYVVSAEGDFVDLRDDLHKRIVNALDSKDAQAKSDLRVRELIHVDPAEDEEEGEDRSLLGKLERKLDYLINSSELHLQAYKDQASKAKKAQLNETQIEAMGNALERKTLFGQLQALKFSVVVEAFIRQQEPSARLPFIEFHKDSPDIQMRKKLINALHHLQGTLSKLEALDGQDPKYFLTRGWYMKSLLFVLLDVLAIKSSLIEASGNPGLTALIQEGNKMLEPLQGLPLIGEYLRNAAAPEQVPEDELDIVALWEAEQRIVKRMRGEITAPAVDEDRSFVDELENVSLQQTDESESNEGVIRPIVGQLFAILKRLREMNRVNDESGQDHSFVTIGMDDAREAQLIQSLSGLSYGPESLGRILKAVETLNAHLTDVGKESRAFAYQTIADLPASIGATLVAIADTAEFHMGYDKPGELSSRITAQFDTFYSSLLESLPFEQEEQRLRLKNSTALLDARIKNEETRREELNRTKETVGSTARTIIQKHLTTFQQIYAEGFESDDQKIKFLRQYNEFQPFLVQVDSAYDKRSFLRTLRTTGHFTAASKAILKLKPKLDELIVSGIEETRAKEIQRCDSRIEYLKEQRKMEQYEAEQKFKLFGASVASRYLSRDVRIRYQEQLGPYTVPFVEAVRKNFEDWSVANPSIQENIEVEVASRIDSLVDSELYYAYLALNTSLNKINAWIEAEEGNSDDNNPLRQEKLDLLRFEQQPLTAAGTFSVETSVEDVKSHCQRVQALINSMKEYNAIIKVYGKLQDMRDYVGNLPKNDINVSKIEEIASLQDMLLKKEKLPKARLQDVEERSESDESKQILFKNSDNTFIKLLKAFWSFLTGWKSKEEQKHTLFKAELNRAKEEIAHALVAQGEGDPLLLRA